MAGQHSVTPCVLSYLIGLWLVLYVYVQTRQMLRFSDVLTMTHAWCLKTKDNANKLKCRGLLATDRTFLVSTHTDTRQQKSPWKINWVTFSWEHEHIVARTKSQVKILIMHYEVENLGNMLPDPWKIYQHRFRQKLLGRNASMRLWCQVLWLHICDNIVAHIS